MDSEHKPWN